MSKHEFPPFNMIIENGRLVPATPYDQERLDSFRRGTKVRVRFTEEKDRVLVRKWFAIIGLVVKQCPVPWKTKEEASEAVKLALGIVNLTKTVKGDFLAYPKSLTDLEDPELQEAVDNMTELLSRMTGVDVETLKKETAHIQPEPDEPHDPDTGELSPNEASDAAPSLAGSDEGGAAQTDASPSSDAPPEEPAGDSVPPAGSDLFGKFNYGPKEFGYLTEFLTKGAKEARKPEDEASKPAKLKFVEMMFLDYSDPEIIFTEDGKTALAVIRRGLDLAIEGSRDIDRIETWARTEFLTEVNGNG
jgi:hypothetical protein